MLKLLFSIFIEDLAKDKRIHDLEASYQTLMDSKLLLSRVEHSFVVVFVYVCFSSNPFFIYRGCS